MKRTVASRTAPAAPERNGLKRRLLSHKEIPGSTQNCLRRGSAMPTLFRFVTILAILGGLAYGAMAALVAYVEPRQTEMTVRVPAERLNPAR